MRKKSTWLAVLAMFAGGVAWAGDVTLIRDGKPTAVIVVANGDKQATAAAKVLVDHLGQMTGAKLDVCSDLAKAPADIKTFVYIGDSDAAKQAGFSSEGLGQGGIIVKTNDNAVAVIGSNAPGDPQTDTYAVIELLEKLGFRYLWPGESGKVIPKGNTVTVPTLDEKYEPKIKQRGIRIAGMSERPLSGLKRIGFEPAEYTAFTAKASETVSPISWSSWQRLGGTTGIVGGAAGCGLRGGWEQWGASHPEWFALQMDGTRDQTAAKERFRLCISNQGLVEHISNDIIERIKENPKLTCISICPNDGGATTFCTCDECAKLDPPDAPKVTTIVYTHPGKSSETKQIEVLSRTDRFVHFWNQIAERVTKVYPNELLLVEAYSCYSLPPVREKLNPNLVVRYVPSNADGWDGWKKAGAKSIYWRPNILISGRRDGMLVGMVAELSKQMGIMGDEMLVTDFDSIMNSWAISGENYYAAAKLDWNPHLTQDQILDDYCGGGFGSAAAPMKQFFKRVEEISRAQFKELAAARKPRIFTPENIAELRGLLASADKAAAGDEAILGRIAFIRLGLNYTDLASQIGQLADEAKGKTGPELAAIKAKAQPLIALHYLVIRDLTKNHTLASWTPYLVWAADDFAQWQTIGGRSYQAPPALVEISNNAALTQSGRENSVDAMFDSFGLKKDAVAAMQAGQSKAAKGDKTEVDADENGNPIKVLK